LTLPLFVSEKSIPVSASPSMDMNGMLSACLLIRVFQFSNNPVSLVESAVNKSKFASSGSSSQQPPPNPENDLNPDELSPAAYQFLKNLPDLSFLLFS
jgi:hypothetical protein